MSGLALITGAAGGIGSEICRVLAADGYDIAAGWAHNEAAAADLAEKLSETYGIKAFPLHIDLSDTPAIGGAYEKCVSAAGEPTVLINNGGSEHIGLFQLMTDSKLIALMNADLIGTMLLTKQALPAMLRLHRGCIVNISSVWGEVGASCEVAYSAAKAGMIGFTRALAKEVAPSGVRVNCVSPGFIDTRMNSQLTDDERAELIDSIPLSRAGKPRDIANAVGFLVSENAGYICGQVLRIDGGWI